MENDLLVTVYIPTFNRVDLLQRAINSVLNQSYKNIEVIVVDDRSTDGTVEYLKDISQKDSRVRYFLKEKNSGACVSRNIAIKNAKGEFITGLDDDDYFTEKRIELFVKFWPYKKKNTVALNALYAVKNHHNLTYGKKLFKNNIIKYNDMFLSNKVGNQIFIQTSVLREIGGFDEGLKCWQDLECWLRVLQLGNIEKIIHHTYVIDISHDKPRIGNSTHQKYIVSSEYISNKFKLDPKHRYYLYLQTLNCNGAKKDLSMYLKACIKYPSFQMLLNTLIFILKGIK